MSKRNSQRNKGGRNRDPLDQPPQIVLRISIELNAAGRVEVDPKFNQTAIAVIDRLYDRAHRDDYDESWDDDHKIAFFQFQVFDEILSQYDDPVDPSEIDPNPTPGVPTMREAPVRDVIDIATMPRANATPIS